MRAPISWLREYAALPADLSADDLAALLVSAGLEVEEVDHAGGDVTGPLVVGRVLEQTPEPQKNGKTINWCRVDVGEHNDESGSRGIVCGAHNFGVGDHVVVSLPGAVLPGGFAIAARKTYGHVSDGMICSAQELGLGDDHDGIIVLTDPDLTPGQEAYDLLHLRDDVLDIAVTPDRGYCFSLRGLAREAAQAAGVVLHDPIDRPFPAPVADGYPVVVESDACATFSAISVRGLDPTRPSPRWLQRRVQLAGMRSISLVVDVTNYVMLETGQPIHAYDAALLDGPIVVRTAAVGEKLTTLDDVVRDLDAADLLITDGSGPIGLAGVMGGASTEISASTDRVVIEAAHFDALTIARTSRRHKLSSEASKRFERGVDPAAGYAAAHRVASLLVELGGGTLEDTETVVGEVPAMPTQTIDPQLPATIMGVAIADEQAIALLQAVGVAVDHDGDRLVLTPPTWRPDLVDPYDYVEEVGRLVGFENVPPVIARAPAGRGLSKSQRLRRAVGAAVAAAGFVETLSFPFVSQGEIDQLGLDADDPRRDLARLANPLADTAPFLRSTLLPGLFGTVLRNTSRSNDDLALYEAGSVFSGFRPPAPRPGVSGPPTAAERAAMETAIGHQPKHLAAVLTGAWLPPSWAQPAVPATWRQAVAFAETAAAAVGVTLSRSATEHSPWHPGRCARLTVGDVLIGYAGELHPSVIKTVGLPARTAAVELDLDALIMVAPDGGEVEAISGHPVAKEDVALVVAESVAQADVERALIAGAGPLLESVRLFDIYRGPQIGEGNKSLAYALRFRAPDRTLTDGEAATARDAAVASAHSATGATQRT